MSKAKKVQMGKDRKIRQKQRAEGIKKNLRDKKHIKYAYPSMKILSVLTPKLLVL